MPDDKNNVTTNDSQPVQHPAQQPAGGVKPKKNNSALKIVLIVIGVLVVLGIIGSMVLGFAFTSLLKKATNNGAVSVKDNTLQVNGKDGSTTSVGENAKLPDGFPSDVPLYPGAKMSMANKSKDTYSVYLATTDSYDKVSQYYKSELTKKGWSNKDEATLSLSNSQSATYSKDQRDLLLIISTGDKNNETGISITVSPTTDTSSDSTSTE